MFLLLRRRGEIKIRAERRIGEFSKELPKSKGNQYSANVHDDKKQNTLKDAGIKHNERYEAIANIPEGRFEGHIATTKDSGKFY